MEQVAGLRTPQKFIAYHVTVSFIIYEPFKKSVVFFGQMENKLTLYTLAGSFVGNCECLFSIVITIVKCLLTKNGHVFSRKILPLDPVIFCIFNPSITAGGCYENC